MYRILIDNFPKYDQLTFDQVRERLNSLKDYEMPRVERFNTLGLCWEYVSLSQFYAMAAA
jgi:hypothetical protein